jgi:hypothetical protein
MKLSLPLLLLGVLAVDTNDTTTTTLSEEPSASKLFGNEQQFEASSDIPGDDGGFASDNNDKSVAFSDECFTTDDCLIDQICIEGVCSKCVEDIQCPANQKCNDGKCFVLESNSSRSQFESNALNSSETSIHSSRTSRTHIQATVFKLANIELSSSSASLSHPTHTAEAHLRISKKQVNNQIDNKNLQIDDDQPHLNLPFKNHKQVSDPPANNPTNDHTDDDVNNHQIVTETLPKLINSNTISGTLFAIIIALCVLIGLYYIWYIKPPTSKPTIDRFSESRDVFVEFKKMNSNDRRRSSMSKIESCRISATTTNLNESLLNIPIINLPDYSDIDKSIRSQSLDTERISRFFNTQSSSLNYEKNQLSTTFDRACIAQSLTTVDRAMKVADLANAYALEQRLSYDSANDSVIENVQ